MTVNFISYRAVQFDGGCLFGCGCWPELEDGFACDRRWSALVVSVTFIVALLLSATIVVVFGHLFDSYLTNTTINPLGFTASSNKI